mmetsp:Transcript_1573/g.9695  ORF Transcript_1573/g.9695 Transcript_1573/m.9695 type:complete len:80 (+) Transcript_1573:543-782(+)
MRAVFCGAHRKMRNDPHRFHAVFPSLWEGKSLQPSQLQGIRAVASAGPCGGPLALPLAVPVVFDELAVANIWKITQLSW